MCTVSSGSGTVANSDVTSVAVACSASFTVGGNVTGLATGQSLVLQDNGGDNLTVSATGPFTFATPLADGAAYAVTVSTQPSGATCSVANGSGNIASANVTNVAVTCASTATTSSTAFSALAVGAARIALVPLNLWASGTTGTGVLPAAIDGTTTITNSGTAYVATSFPITSCTTDSANLLAICMNYQSTSVAVLDFSRFSTTFNVSDIVEHEFDTGAPNTQSGFSGGQCTLCGVVAVPAMKSFVVSAFDGYRVYAYRRRSTTCPSRRTSRCRTPMRG
jgi:hypothetical protein